MKKIESTRAYLDLSSLSLASVVNNLQSCLYSPPFL